MLYVRALRDSLAGSVGTGSALWEGSQASMRLRERASRRAVWDAVANEIAAFATAELRLNFELARDLDLCWYLCALTF